MTIRPGTDPSICVISEYLLATPDEGTNRFASGVATALTRRQNVVALGTRAASLPGSVLTPAPRTFLGAPLRRALEAHKPDVTIYVATASTTLGAFVRSRVLKAYCPQGTVVLVGLQPRRHTWVAQRLIGRMVPDLVCVQSLKSQQYLRSLGCRTEIIPGGVDLETFHPVPPEQRRALRGKYDLAEDTTVVLHVGHLKRGRGIEVLAEVAARGGCQVVLVTSTTTQQDRDLADQLCGANVRLFTDYQPRVEELYQLADCYIFPVTRQDHAIEVPLSVLEALACDLPVVTTPFGGLPALFGERPCHGLVFAEWQADLVSESLRLGQARVRGTRSLAAPYSWDAVADLLLEQALSSRRPAGLPARTPAEARRVDLQAAERGVTGGTVAS